MGSACCIAAKDRTTANRSTRDILHRNVRYSPSWSFRWDNRGRVVGEDTTFNWSSDGVSGTDRFDFKSRTTVEAVFASEEGSPLDSFRSHPWQKSPTSERNGEIISHPSSDPFVATNSTEITESTRSPAVTYPSPAQPASPLSNDESQQLPSVKMAQSSSLMLPGWSNESNHGSHGGSSDGWSIPTFHEFLPTPPRRERWSFDSESLSFFCGRTPGSPSLDLRTCGICVKLLTEKSSWGGRKAISSNEIAVVSVLTCGHAFHAECLENMTLEINKYDPACPICTLGEKQVSKMCEKGLKAEMNSKARKKYRNRVVDSDFNGNLAGMLDVGRCPKTNSSSRPSLRRHFSFGGSKGTPRSLSENDPARKRGFFWTRSSKEKASSWAPQ
ncbi:unnamed protein product [Cuscuta epithymum]|uniref:RING-type domain-containing protein n=1 Tax=Cuscuta epithymum TaxID=186058 RepID=A0AAV0CMN7_9ASTE|nr:unnamed protein product [Cuscuta epithymum]CAH9079569.1 unnamed protein product [Cuscuta epithymum]